MLRKPSLVRILQNDYFSWLAFMLPTVWLLYQLVMFFFQSYRAPGIATQEALFILLGWSALAWRASIIYITESHE